MVEFAPVLVAPLGVPNVMVIVEPLMTIDESLNVWFALT